MHVCGVKGGTMSRHRVSNVARNNILKELDKVEQIACLSGRVSKRIEFLRSRLHEEKQYQTPKWVGSDSKKRSQSPMKMRDEWGQFDGDTGLKCWALDWELIERRSRES